MRRLYALAAVALLGAGLASWAALAWGQASAGKQPIAESRSVVPPPPAPVPELPPGPVAVPEPMARTPIPAPKSATPAADPAPPAPPVPTTVPDAEPRPLLPSLAPTAEPKAAALPPAEPMPPAPPAPLPGPITNPALPAPLLPSTPTTVVPTPLAPPAPLAPPSPVPPPALPTSEPIRVPAGTSLPNLPSPMPTPVSPATAPSPMPLPVGTMPVAPATSAGKPKPIAPAAEVAPAALPHTGVSAKPLVSPVEERAIDSIPTTADTASRRQEPAVVLEWVGPSTARIGQPMECGVIVRNTCAIPVQQVMVRVRVPAGIRVAGTEPRGLVESNVVVWDLGTLASRQEHTLQLRLVAETRGDLMPQAWVTFTGSSVMRLLVREPKLAVRAAGPERLQVGDPATIVLTVSNPGDGPAERVKIHATLSEGLESASGKRVDMEIGNLAPGESRNVQLLCAARIGGDQRCDVVAEADGSLRTEAQALIGVCMPRLDLQVAGPRLRYVDRKALYSFKIHNGGDAPASNVIISDQVPEGFKFLTASDGGRQDQASRAVYWFLGDLPPGQTREVKLEVVAIGTGDHRQHALVQAARGLHAESEVLTRIECVSALQLELNATEDPVEAGADTTFEVRIVNGGSRMETNVRLACVVPDQVELKSVGAPVAHHVEGRTLVFDPLSSLAPHADVVFRVQVKAVKPGDVRFRAQVSSTNLAEPVSEMKVTHIYADTPTTVGRQ